MKVLTELLDFPFWVRFKLYTIGFLPKRNLPKPTISIGSLIIGGAGKTPMTEFLAKTLIKMGLRPGIITIGYGRKSKGLVVLHGPPENWLISGDEPAMLAQNLPNTPIAIHKNRELAAEAIKDEVDVYILDDAFQNLCTKRDLDILMLTCKEAKTAIFPFGLRRDTIWRLREIDKNKAIAIAKKGRDCQYTKKFFRHVFTFQTMPELIFNLKNPETNFDINWINGKKVYLTAGIANPERFTESMLKCGASIVGHKWFLDHRLYRPAQVKRVVRDAKKLGAEIILTTQKDAVRIKAFAPENMFAVKIALRIEPHDDFIRLIKEFISKLL